MLTYMVVIAFHQVLITAIIRVLEIRRRPAEAPTLSIYMIGIKAFQ
jgi:hypothetical protein